MPKELARKHALTLAVFPMSPLNPVPESSLRAAWPSRLVDTSREPKAGLPNPSTATRCTA
eukprot:4175678-Pleurochrysis_carterae.AAC.2